MASELAVRSPKWQRQSSLWRKILGWACVGLGFLGIILPIIPGIPLLVLGLMFLATQHRWAHELLVWTRTRFRSFRAAHQHHSRAPEDEAPDARRPFWRRNKP